MAARDRWSEEDERRYGLWREGGPDRPAEGYPEDYRREEGSPRTGEHRRSLYGAWEQEPGSHRGRGPKGYRRSDERILEDVCDRLADDRHIDASEIEVAVAGGEVTLSGMVDDRGTRRRAEDLVEQVSGVTHVQNNLRPRQQGTTATLGGYGTPVAAAYGLDATPSADAPRHGSTAGPATIGPTEGAVAGSGQAAAASGGGTTAPSARPGMRTIMALFDSRAEADRAAAELHAIGVPQEAVSVIRDETGATAVATDTSKPPREERGFLASLAALFLPAEDQRSYEEGIRRGGVLVAARVEERQAEETVAALETAGAVDLDERVGQWQATGWRQYEPLPPGESPGQAGRGGRRVRSYAAVHAEDAGARH
jgi:hypothetical protein